VVGLLSGLGATASVALVKRLMQLLRGRSDMHLEVTKALKAGRRQDAWALFNSIFDEIEAGRHEHGQSAGCCA
jgi:hypothetical protein